MNPSRKKTFTAIVIVVAAAIVGLITWSSRSNMAIPGKATSGTTPASSSNSLPTTTAQATTTSMQVATSTTWQSYISKTVHISFRYPPGWSLGPNTPISIDNFNHAYQGDSIIPMGGAEIDVANTKYYGSLGDLIRTVTMSGSIHATSSVAVNNVLCTEVSYGSSYAPGYPSSNIGVYCSYPGNGLLYEAYLSYRATDPKGAQYAATFGQFLNTVQFMAQ